jgi:hypothetical protein
MYYHYTRRKKIVKKEILGIVICILLVITVLPVSATSHQKFIQSNDNAIGTKWNYKSLKDIPSPDGNNYRCIMFCDDHEQTLKWISLINESGFKNAWQKKFIELTIFFTLPGTILLFGLADFRNWYAELFIKLRYKNEFSDFLTTYDIVNGSGMITYLWLSGMTNRPVDFKAQPDNSWVEDSWILDPNNAYIPNPEIWREEPFFWFFDLPFS